MVFLRALQLRTPTNHLSQVGGLIVHVNIANIASHFDVSLRGLCCVQDFRISLWSKAVTADHLAWHAFLLIFLHIICLLIFRFLYMIFYIFECAKLRWSTAEGETGSLPRGGCNCFRCVLRKQAMTGKWKEGATKNSFADLKRTWFGLWRNSWIRSILSNPIITL